MSPAKLIMVLIYVVLAVLALTGVAGSWPGWVLLVLAVVHAIETAVYLPLCRQAGGSLPRQLLQVFLFGVLHVQELKRGRA